MSSRTKDKKRIHNRNDQTSASSSNAKNGHVTQDERTNPLLKPETSTRKTFKHASLHQLEIPLCFLFSIGCCLYIKYRMSVLSKEHIGSMQLTFFQKPWFFWNHGYRDISDYEWRFWMIHSLTLNVLLTTVAYVVLGRLVDWKCPKIRKMYILSFSLLSVYITMSSRTIAFFVGHTALAYIGSLTKRKWVVWLVAVIQITTIFASVDFYRWQKSYIPELGQVVVPLTFSILRFVSFGLEYCRKDDKSKDYGMLDLLVYNYYYPLFFLGPVLTFEAFQAQIKKTATPMSKHELWNILKQILRCSFWFVYTDIFLHFSYYSAFNKHPEILRSLAPKDFPVLAGWHLMFFQLKYILFYGFPRVVALFDRIEAPHTPACIMGLYTFRDMWRYFDRGIHTFIERYIYFPLGGSKFGVVWSSMGALLAFSFMAMWHGGSYKMLSWALCNWLGIQLETIVIGMSWTSFAIQKQISLSGPMLRRLCALVAAFNIMFLVVSNMIFLTGFPVFWIYFNRVFVQGFPWVPLGMYIFFYCNAQVSMELQRRYSADYIYNKKYI